MSSPTFSRRQLLIGFLSVPAVIFANRALIHRQTSSLQFPLEGGPRALWGQALIDGEPWGDPFLMEATPASRGVAKLRNVHELNFENAPRSGYLAVQVSSAEYGTLGVAPIQLSGPITSGATVAITAFVMGAS